jgi:two-component system phosphate regulon response regulator OmpR
LHTILIVDDDERIRYLLTQYLKHNGPYNVFGAHNVASAKSVLINTHVDLIVLDIMLPDESGFDFLHALRSGSVSNDLSNISVIFLSAKDQLDERLEGLSLQADDYITKPFEPKELVLRIQSVLRRTTTSSAIKNTKHILGDFSFNTTTLELKQGQVDIQLTTTECALLKYFIERVNQPVSRLELATYLGHHVSERTIDVQVARLRKKLGEDESQKYLKTVRHVGYMLCDISSFHD